MRNDDGLLSNGLAIRGGYSESINMLRLPLAILVVFVHAFGNDIDVAQLLASDFTGMAIYDYIRIFFSVTIARCAVPIFFIISGYLFFLKVHTFGKREYVQKLRKRVHSLLVPYLAWILLLLLWTMAFKVGGILLHGKPWNGILEFFEEQGWWHLFWDSSVWDEHTTWWGTLAHNSGPYLLPFWYMRDLIMMVLLAPVVYWLAKRLKVGFILILLVIYGFDIRFPCISSTFAIAALFFSLGAYWGIMKQDFTLVLWRWRYVICPVAAVLVIWQTYTGSANGDALSMAIHPWMVVMESLAFIILASAMCRYQSLYRFNQRLAKTSFFIYALHPIILGYVVRVFHKVLPMDCWYVLTFNYLMAPLVCVGICVAGYYLLNRFMPKVLGVLVGERRK